MKIAIALYDRFTALDAIGPYETLSRLPGAEVVFVGCEQRVFRTDIGALAIVAGASFADVDRADVLVVPGGPGTREMEFAIAAPAEPEVDIWGATRKADLFRRVFRVDPTFRWLSSTPALAARDAVAASNG